MSHARQIILDTETTGLEPAQGHRLVELAGLELVNRRRTGSHFHRYLNPQRDIDQGALEAHGLTPEFLGDKPLFREVAQEFLEYVRGAELIIHNAPFDVGFLDAELGLLGLGRLGDYCPVVTDTLRMAKDLHPGKKNSLDALCERYQVDNSRRVFHGALLDAELLSDVYLAMTRGQENLLVDIAAAPAAPQDPLEIRVRRAPRVILATADELAEHERQLEQIGRASKGGCLWSRPPAA